MMHVSYVYSKGVFVYRSNVLNSALTNWLPLSETKCSGIPNWEKSLRRTWMVFSDVATLMGKTSSHLECESTTMRNIWFKNGPAKSICSLFRLVSCCPLCFNINIYCELSCVSTNSIHVYSYLGAGLLSSGKEILPSLFYHSGPFLLDSMDQLAAFTKYLLAWRWYCIRWKVLLFLLLVMVRFSTLLSEFPFPYDI